MMVIGGGASVTLRIAAGFDTYGIRRAIETGDGAQVLDSLYFKTVDANGTPIPVVQFTGYLEAGASVSIGILEVGVLGGIKLTVGFYWNDPNNDGKFRLFEFAGAVANNPICLFNVGGELSLYIKVFVEIGFSPFAVTSTSRWSTSSCSTSTSSPTAPRRRRGWAAPTATSSTSSPASSAAPDRAATTPWDAERQGRDLGGPPGAGVHRRRRRPHAAAVEVRGLGLTETFPDTGGNPITTVVLDGRGYAGNLTVSFTGGSAPVEGAKPGAVHQEGRRLHR